MKPGVGLTAVVALLACVGMSIPVLAAILMLQRHTVEAEDAFILRYAQDTLTRAEQTSDQLATASRTLNALPAEELCSPKGLAVMRRLDLGSTLLQAVGRVEGDVIRCSSVGALQPIALGPPDFVTARGTTMRTSVPLFGQAGGYLVVASGRFVGIVHKQLALSFVEHAQDMALSAFSWSHRAPLLVRGRLDPRWLAGPDLHEGVYRRGGYLIAVVRSSRYDVGAIAAVPVAHTSGLAWKTGVVLIPLGLLSGGMVALLIVISVRNRLSLSHLIQRGLKRGEFHLEYQPVVELASGRIVGAEALLRWRRPDGEVTPPDIFIPVAEKARLIRQVTAYALTTLSTDIQHCPRLPDGFHIAINLSAEDLHDPETVDALTQFAKEARIGLPNLIVEATERSFVDAALARPVLGRLRALGVRVAIDDFGTGYSSLGYIANLEVDYLKIDKLFVQALGTRSATSPVAAHIIEMARDLKLSTIAEGVETQQQAAILASLGVRYAQGWLYGRPVALAEVLRRARDEAGLPPLLTVVGG